MENLTREDIALIEEHEAIEKLFNQYREDYDAEIERAGGMLPEATAAAIKDIVEPLGAGCNVEEYTDDPYYYSCAKAAYATYHTGIKFTFGVKN